MKKELPNNEIFVLPNEKNIRFQTRLEVEMKKKRQCTLQYDNLALINTKTITNNQFVGKAKQQILEYGVTGGREV